MKITITASSKKLSEAQKVYRQFFKDKLAAYNVRSPAELSEEDKSKFFSEITPEWDEFKKENDIQIKE